jgi:hypothetical protein
MHGTIRRIWWTVGTLCALVLVAAVALVVQARVEAVRAPDRSGAGVSAVNAAAVASRRPAAEPAAPAGAAIASAETVARAGAKVVEVCGFEPVRLSSAASEEDNDQRLDEAVAQAPMPWTDMQASGDERIRAAGFALAARIEPLVKLAAQTRDATVYAMAQSTCASLGNDPANSAAATDKAWCETLDADQRASLEPDNAVAWLALAADAEAKRDPTTVDDALRRAAAAPALRHHTIAAAAQVERHAAQARPSAASLWVHRALEDAGLHSEVLPASICADRGRREVCQQIAQRLLDQPNAIGDLAQGLALGRQLGLDEAMLARKRDELEAVQQVEAARMERWAGPERYGCAALGSKRDWARKAQAQGEWRAARDAAVAQAGSLDALLKRFREANAPAAPNEGERR